MISPEILRRYPVFGNFDDKQLKTLAMITNEKTVKDKQVIFTEKTHATHLYFLISGGIDLYNEVSEQFRPETKKEFSAGEINPGELFGVSSLIDPYVYTTCARSSSDSMLLDVDVEQLKLTIDKDAGMGNKVLQTVSKQLLERLNLLRIQIASL